MHDASVDASVATKADASVASNVAHTRSPLHGVSLEELGERARACRLCRLCATRTQVVCGQGNPNADVMFVAEGPGYHDDRRGNQLSGTAGDLFDQMLDAIGYTRDDVWLTSVIKCRTPDGRSSFPDEIEMCEGYLFREVSLVRPRVICALGNTPIRLLTGRPLRLSDVHGTPIVVSLAGNDVTVLPLYHPSAVVQVPLLTDTLRTDIQLIPRLLRRDAARVRTFGSQEELNVRTLEKSDPGKAGGDQLVDVESESTVEAAEAMVVVAREPATHRAASPPASDDEQMSFDMAGE